MTSDLSLFGDDEPQQLTEPVQPTTRTVASWQIELLRKALDARGLTTTDERQTAIQAAVGHSVQSLRELTQGEGFQVLAKLGESSKARPSAAEAWDERDEDTWIDRL